MRAASGTLDDLARLPPTPKQDYITDPRRSACGRTICRRTAPTEERVLWDIAYTTGTTTGKPSPFYNTAHDAYGIWDQARRCNEAEGARSRPTASPTSIRWRAFRPARSSA